MGKELMHFLESKGPLLDVRSPAEYATGHIPGAHTFPLFTDEERSELGTLYKQISREAAIERGLEIVGPKMPDFIREAKSFNSQQFRLYCWRGGMRSGSMSWLFQTYRFQVAVLPGGYKTYRGQLLDWFESAPYMLRVLTGYTGSGKTRMLKAMQQQGAQVIDLEGLANHQGSSFGNQLSDRQPTTEQFQNELLMQFQQLDLNKPIWIEDESMRIGQVNLPEPLFRRQLQSPLIYLEVPKPNRIRLLVEDYGQLKASQLIQATRAIEKKLGVAEAKACIALIQACNLAPAADLLLTYYDKRYQKSIAQRSELIEADIHWNNEPIEQIAEKILNTQKCLFN